MPLWSRLTNVFRSNRLNRQIDEELRAHLEDAVEQRRDPRAARRAFGSTLRIREECRDARLISWLDALRTDAVFGWRQLMKQKVTSLAAVLSLALAIGACTSAFRLIDALLLRPLPVASPGRLYQMRQEGMDPGGNMRIGESSEYPLFRQLRDAVREKAVLIASSYANRTDLTYSSDQEMEKGWRQYVSGWMFDTFGMKPALGRLFTERDDMTPGAHPVAVISHAYWQRRFGGEASVIGRTFRIGDDLYEIVGVAPREFTGTEPGITIDFFLPAMMNPYVTRSDASWFRTFVYLNEGVPPAPVLEQLRSPFQAFQEGRAKGFTGKSKRMLDAFLTQKLLLEPAPTGSSDRQKEYRTALIALGGIVAMVLLIACANVANLMTAQAAARKREMALRISIGAGRSRLVQLVLVESAILAALAAALGGLFALWSAPMVAARINPPGNPAHLDLHADWRVLAFGLLLTLCVTALFGVAPALRASSVRPMETLRGGSEDPYSRRRMMHALIAIQVAFCFVVLFAAGLFVETFRRLEHQPIGFSSERTLVVDTVARRGQEPVFWEQAAEHLRSLPGIERVSLSGWALLDGNGWNGYILQNGAPINDTLPYFLAVSPGWLETMRMPLRDGRDFRPGDTFPGGAIVNEAFAKAYFNGENPVGRWFEKEQGKMRARIEIIGLVPDARYRNVRERQMPVVYVPFLQTNAAGEPLRQKSAAFLVRTSAANPLAVAGMLRQEVPKANAEFRASNIRTQQELVDQHLVRERVLAALALFFSGVALLLSGVGLYGVLDYSVLQRRREIGIRMAIGAQAGEIVRNVTSSTFAVVAAGAVFGLGFGFFGVRYISTLLYGVKPVEVTVLAAPAGAILVAAMLASLPAVIRAVRIDPARILRSE